LQLAHGLMVCDQSWFAECDARTVLSC
jgi:hypothetical protein